MWVGWVILTLNYRYGAADWAIGIGGLLATAFATKKVMAVASEALAAGGDGGGKKKDGPNATTTANVEGARASPTRKRTLKPTL